MINWEWSWSHAGKTALDAIGLIPVIGSVKNADEAASIVNGVAKHGDDALDSGGKIVKHGDQLVEGMRNFKTNAQSKIDDLRSQMPNNKLTKEGNMATAEVDIPGIKTEFNAHSKINNPSNKGSNISDFSYLKPENERIFESYVSDGRPGAEYPRFHDTEAKILEDIASQLKNPNVSGSVNLYTELDACQSCSNIILEFRKKFPNIKLNIFTGQ